jgi:hypothetical protein
MPPTKRTAARGYGGAHQRERARWAPKVARGIVDCWRCGQLIQPGRPWDLGHDDDRRTYRGPEHPSCNRQAGGKNGAAVTNARRTPGIQHSRDW